MQSNREDFFDIREQDCNNIPPAEELEEAKTQPIILSALEIRANAYLAGIERNRLKKSIQNAIDFGATPSHKSDHSDIDFNPEFIGPKQLTEFQKLYHIPESSEETKKQNLKNIENGFKNLRNKSR